MKSGSLVVSLLKCMVVKYLDLFSLGKILRGILIPLTKFFGNISERNFFFTKGFILIISLLAVLIIFTIIGEKYDIDRLFSSIFFSLEKDWYLGDTIPWKWLYDYGAIPGILVSIISFFLLGICRKNTKIKQIRPYLLICGFTPIIASLIIVNVVLKDHTGRPRPREITNFNGNWNYKPVLKVGIPGKGHSFPCGHCSIAFTLTSGIVFFRIIPKFALLSFSTGLIYGILMSIARILQGGHFLSDTIWSLGVVLSTIIVLYYFIFQPPLKEKSQVSFLTKKKKLKIFSYISLALTLLIVFVFTRRPFFKDHIKEFEINNDIKLLELHVPNNWDLTPKFIDKINDGSYLLEIKGYAPPYTTHYLNFVPKINGNIMKLQFNENIIGYKRDFSHHLDLTLPSRFNGNLEIYKKNSNNNILNFK